MQKEGTRSVQDIAIYIRIAPNVVRRTLERLRQRDLILFEDGGYRIASLTIERWVERNS
jgi:predicted ArsR family transcriptional regulator